MVVPFTYYLSTANKKLTRDSFRRKYILGKKKGLQSSMQSYDEPCENP